MEFANKSDRLTKAILNTTVWVPVVIFSLFLKYKFIYLKYFPFLYEATSSLSPPSLIDKLFMFSSDILITMLVAPILICLSFWFTDNNKWIKRGVMLLTIVSLTLLWGNLHSWGTVSQFLSMTSVIDAVTFGLQNPEFVEQYIDSGSKVKFAGVVLCSIAAYLLAERFAKINVFRKFTIGLASAYLISSATLVVVTSQSSISSVPGTNSFLGNSLVNILSSKSTSRKSFSSDNDLVQAFLKLSNRHNEHSTESSTYHGTAKDNDLIVMVLETDVQFRYSLSTMIFKVDFVFKM